MLYKINLYIKNHHTQNNITFFRYSPFLLHFILIVIYSQVLMPIIFYCFLFNRNAFTLKNPFHIWTTIASWSERKDWSRMHWPVPNSTTLMTERAIKRLIECSNVRFPFDFQWTSIICHKVYWIQNHAWQLSSWEMTVNDKISKTTSKQNLQ